MGKIKIGAAGAIFIADHRRRNALHCEAMLREPTTNVELDVRQSQFDSSVWTFNVTLGFAWTPT
jgi:hypothetical protein